MIATRRLLSSVVLEVRNLTHLDNGGDGLVAARHLRLLGYQHLTVMVIKPLKDDLAHLGRVLTEHENIPVAVYSELQNPDEKLHEILQQNDLVVDCLFGYSFSGPMRDPYPKIIGQFSGISHKVLSVDIPSGWDVEKGNQTGELFTPAYNISLMLPKLGMENYKGKHYLGGRFIPASLEKEFGLLPPKYPGNSLFTEI